MSSRSTDRLDRAPRPRWLASAVALLLAAAGACTEVQMEDTNVDLISSGGVCSNSSAGGSTGGGAPSSSAPAVMDTAVVQLYELNDPANATAKDCDTCFAAGNNFSNCFFEKESCVCGDAGAVSGDRLKAMVAGLKVGLRDNFGSLYCLRVLGVERLSQGGDCACDPSWVNPDHVRMCSLSKPYAASSLPIQMNLACSDDRTFTTCMGAAASGTN